MEQIHPQSSDQEDNNICVVCLEPLNGTPIGAIHPCGHVIHCACWEMWTSHQGRRQQRQQQHRPQSRSRVSVYSSQSPTESLRYDSFGWNSLRQPRSTLHVWDGTDDPFRSLSGDATTTTTTTGIKCVLCGTVSRCFSKIYLDLSPPVVVVTAPASTLPSPSATEGVGLGTSGSPGGTPRGEASWFQPVMHWYRHIKLSYFIPLMHSAGTILRASQRQFYFHSHNLVLRHPHWFQSHTLRVCCTRVGVALSPWKVYVQNVSRTLYVGAQQWSRMTYDCVYRRSTVPPTSSVGYLTNWYMDMKSSYWNPFIHSVGTMLYDSKRRMQYHALLLSDWFHPHNLRRVYTMYGTRVMLVLTPWMDYFESRGRILCTTWQQSWWLTYKYLYQQSIGHYRHTTRFAPEEHQQREAQPKRRWYHDSLWIDGQIGKYWERLECFMDSFV